MSRALDLGCRDCNVRIWVGQADYLYINEASQWEAFLFAHIGHSLVFDDAEVLAATTDMLREELSDD